MPEYENSQVFIATKSTRIHLWPNTRHGEDLFQPGEKPNDNFPRFIQRNKNKTGSRNWNQNRKASKTKRDNCYNINCKEKTGKKTNKYRKKRIFETWLRIEQSNACQIFDTTLGWRGNADPAGVEAVVPILPPGNVFAYVDLFGYFLSMNSNGWIPPPTLDHNEEYRVHYAYELQRFNYLRYAFSRGSKYRTKMRIKRTERSTTLGAKWGLAKLQDVHDPGKRDGACMYEIYRMDTEKGKCCILLRLEMLVMSARIIPTSAALVGGSIFLPGKFPCLRSFCVV